MYNAQRNIGIEPYNDDFLIFDELSGRYIITEEGLKRKGMLLRTRLERYPGVDPTTVINAFCEAAANLVYTYIHNFAVSPHAIDEFIAHSAEARRAIFNAEAEEAKYVYYNGDLTLSIKEEERRNYMSPTAAAILQNAGLTYAGGW